MKADIDINANGLPFIRLYPETVTEHAAISANAAHLGARRPVDGRTGYVVGDDTYAIVMRVAAAAESSLPVAPSGQRIARTAEENA